VATSRKSVSELRRDEQVFRRAGDYWTIEFDGTVVCLRDTKGLRHLAVLLRSPGRPVHVTALVAAARNSRRPPRPPPVPAFPSRSNPAGAAANADVEAARLAVTKTLKLALERIADHHPTLAEHLAVTIRRGYFCVYAPDPRHAKPWTQ